MVTFTRIARRMRPATLRDRWFDITNAVFLTLFTGVVLYPLIYVVSASFSSPDAVMAGRVWLFPVDLSLEGYHAVFKNRNVIIGYANSLFYTSVGTTINVFITLFAAYSLSQKDLPGRTLIMVLFAFTMLFSGGIIPLYLVVKATLGVNNRWNMLLPNAMAVGNLIIARTFIQHTLPGELRESAIIDGSDDFRFFFMIALPLLTPLIGVLTMLYALGHWNSFFHAFIFLSSKKLFPLQLVLRNILIINEMGMDTFGDLEYLDKIAGLKNLLKFSLIVVSSVPLLILYPFVQRYFVKGIMIGSIKG